jgi:hypothetical protein
VSVLVPDWVAKNLQKEHLINQQVEGVPYWNRLLKDIDPNLSLVLVGDGIPPQPDMVAGAWHVRRRNQGTPDTYIPILDGNGRPRPMASDVIDKVRSMDLWDNRVHRDLWKRIEEQDRAAELKVQRAQEEAADEMRVNLKAVLEPSILVNTDIPFKAKARGRTEKKK